MFVNLFNKTHKNHGGFYLVFETKVEVGQHVQTWGQKGHLTGNDAQLPLFCLPWVASDTNDVTAAQFVVDGHKSLLRLVVSNTVKYWLLLVRILTKNKP